MLLLLPRDSEHSAPTPCKTRGTGLASEAVAGALHHGRAMKERGLSPAQCPRVEPRPTTTRVTWRARPASLVVRLVVRDSEHSAPTLRKTRGTGLALEAAADTLHHGRATKERGISPAQCLRLAYGPPTVSAARRTREGSSSAAPLPQRQRAQRASAPRDTSGAGLELEAAGGTSHHGRAPEERGLSPAEVPYRT